MLQSIRSYHTAGNIGGQLNLALWRLGKRPSNLNPSNLSVIYATYVLFYPCACAHIICTELPPNLNLPIFLFRPLGTKPPNLKIANIYGYMVYYKVYQNKLHPHWPIIVRSRLDCNDVCVLHHVQLAMDCFLSVETRKVGNVSLCERESERVGGWMGGWVSG